MYKITYSKTFLLFGCLSLVFFSNWHVSAFTKSRQAELLAKYQLEPQAQANTAEEFFFKALSEQKNGNYQNSLINYQAVLSIDPNDQDTHANLCGLLSQLDRFNEAKQECNKALQQDNNSNGAIYFNLGIAEIGLADYESALVSFQNSLKFAREQKDNLLISQLQERIDLVRKVVTHELSSKGVQLYWKGLSKSSAGDLKDTVKLYDEAIKQDPSFVEAYLEKANTEALQKNYKAAFKNYQKVQELNPNLLALYNNRAAVFIQYKGDFNNATKDLNTALQLAKSRNDQESIIYFQQLINKVQNLQQNKQ
jgi:tetratricopeptide (TPR) repeat protein